MWFHRALLPRANPRSGELIRCKYSSSSSSYYSDAPTKKVKAAPLQERRLRDRVRIWAKGGEGGNGCWSYRRGRNDRFGKPDVVDYREGLASKRETWREALYSNGK